MLLTILLTLLALIVLLLASSRFSRRFFLFNPHRTYPARHAGAIESHPFVLTLMQWKSTSFDPALQVALAAQFGWLPALLWLVFGGLISGWLQDFSGLFLSLRTKQRSLSGVYQILVSEEAGRRTALLEISFLGLLLAGLTALLIPLFSRPEAAAGLLALVLAAFLGGWVKDPRWAVLIALFTVGAVLLSPAAGPVQAAKWWNGLAGSLYQYPLGEGAQTWTGFFWSLVIFASLWGVTRPGGQKTLAYFQVFSTLTAAMVISLALVGVSLAFVGGRFPLEFELPAITSWQTTALGPLWPVLFVLLVHGTGSGWAGLVALHSSGPRIREEQTILPVAVMAGAGRALLVIFSLVLAASLGVSSGRYDAGQGYRLVAGSGSVFVGGVMHFLTELGLSDLAALSLSVILLSQFLLGGLLAISRVYNDYAQTAYQRPAGKRWRPFWQPGLGLAVILLALWSGLWQWFWPMAGGLSLALAGLLLLAAALRTHRLRGRTWPLAALGLLLIFTALAGLLYSGLYQSLFVAVLQATSTNPGQRAGNLLTGASALWLCWHVGWIAAGGLKQLVIPAAPPREGAEP